MLQGVVAQTSCQPLNGTGFNSNLNFYSNMNGSGTISNGTTITPAVGAAGTVVNPNGLGMSYVDGNTSQGIKFGGDDYINFGSHATSTTYTISLWVKPGTLTTSRPILQRGDATQCYYNPNITIVSSTGVLAASESGCGGSGSIATATISLTKWSHVVVTRRFGVSKLYVDGVFKGSTSTIGNENWPGRLTVGASWNSSGSVYNSFSDATIDDVAIMTVELSATQVAALYASQNCNR